MLDACWCLRYTYDMKHIFLPPSPRKKAFTMVEMLAVIAVMAIIVAMVVPNGIHARSVGEEATVRAQAASIEMGLATCLMQYGALAKEQYLNLAKNTGNATNDTNTVITFLKGFGALPDSVQAPVINKVFSGYTVTYPQNIDGAVVVRGGAGGTQIYP